MTVRQLLASIDSAELTEWMVMTDLDVWKKRIDEKAPEKPLTGAQLFGKLFKK